MANKSAAQWRAELLDKYVQADDSVADLARFRNRVGKVVTVNENGAVLVDFADGAWYDLPPQHLMIVPKPAPPEKKPEKPTKSKAGG